MESYDKKPYDNLEYCVRCALPETTEGIQFDEMGICQACQAAEQKIHIDWTEREKQLCEILAHYKSIAGDNYDCIVPISGGKDSMFQLHVLTKVYNMKPLAVTFCHNWFSETGRYNLENALEKFNVDHIMFTPNRDLVNKLACKSLFAIGDACWTCHAGVGAFPLQIALRFNIPLLVWGESIAEESARATYYDPVLKFDRDYFTRVSAKVYPEYMVGGTLTAKDLKPFELPSHEDLERVGMVGIHLGDFMFWDGERQMEFVRDTYGWREDYIEETYKGYKSVECIMAGVHDYMKYIKRGFGRTTDHVSVDLRAGLLSRDEAIELVREIDKQRPEALDYFIQITGLSEKEIIESLIQLRTGAAKRLPCGYSMRGSPIDKPTLRPAVIEKIEKMSAIKDPRVKQEKRSASKIGPTRKIPLHMAADRLSLLSASDAVRLIRAGEISSRDLLEDCLKRIEAMDHRIHAWVYLAPELALDKASAVDNRIKQGESVGPLAGIPVGVKDIFNTADMPTQMGSPIWKDFTSGNDARVVHYLRMSDAVFPGKTVTAEFAVHTPGPTANPHNIEYMPGTSSSGSAAAVASCMVPLALGTQTAGSILRPASYCGVYGFKPSFGVVPRTGMLKTTDSLDTVGFFARTPADLELMFNVIRVVGPDYPLCYEAFNDRTRQSKGRRPWKVALVKGPMWNNVEEYAKTALFGFMEKLVREKGIIVEEVALSPAFSKAHDIHATIYDKTLAYYFKEEFKKQTLISTIMYEIITRGNRITLDQYKKALQEQTQLSMKFEELMTNFDAILTLSTGGVALKGLESEDRPDSCLVWTLCGAPAINLPVFVGPNQLPFGAQLVGRRYNDYLLLNLVHFLRSRDLVPDGPNPVPTMINEVLV